jgi:hypothetical protein
MGKRRIYIPPFIREAIKWLGSDDHEIEVFHNTGQPTKFHNVDKFKERIKNGYIMLEDNGMMITPFQQIRGIGCRTT